MSSHCTCRHPLCFPFHSSWSEMRRRRTAQLLMMIGVHDGSTTAANGKHVLLFPLFRAVGARRGAKPSKALTRSLRNLSILGEVRATTRLAIAGGGVEPRIVWWELGAFALVYVCDVILSVIRIPTTEEEARRQGASPVAASAVSRCIPWWIGNIQWAQGHGLAGHPHWSDASVFVWSS